MSETATTEKRVAIRTRCDDVPVGHLERFTQIVMKCGKVRDTKMRVEIAGYDERDSGNWYLVQVTAPESKALHAELDLTIPLDDWAH